MLQIKNYFVLSSNNDEKLQNFVKKVTICQKESQKLVFLQNKSIKIKFVALIFLEIRIQQINIKSQSQKQMYEIIKSMKAIHLFLAFILLSLSINAGGIQLQYGTYIAKAVSGSGSIALRAYGGSGNYVFNFNNLPIGWRSSGDTLIIPNIVSTYGRSYLLSLQIRDSRNSGIFSANINLIVNGLRIDVSSAGIGSSINIASTSNSFTSSSQTINGVTTSTSTSTSTGPTTTGSQSLSSLYSSYPGISTIVNPPSLNPSPAGSPSVPNPAPQIIQNSQATYNYNRDANTITLDQIKRTAVFNRQINANKAVANLVTIIQRLTANVNAAKIDIVTLTGLLSKAQVANNQCNEQIFNFANTKAKIENAIIDRENTLLVANGNIENVQNTLNGLKLKFNNLVGQRNLIQSKKSPNSAKLDSLEKQLQDCLSKKDVAFDQVNKLNQQVDALNLNINTIRTGASSAPGRISQIDRQIPTADRKIADLKRELADAEEDRLQLSQDRKMYQDQINNAATEIRNIERTIATTKGKIPGLQSKLDTINRNCERIQKELSVFRSSLGEQESSYLVLLSEINAQTTLVDAKQGELDRIKNSIKDLPNEIQLLRSELGRITIALRSQSFICQTTADDVRRANQNLEALRIKLDKESGYLVQANANLEAARSEKQLADIAVEEVIQTYTTALPFAIVPNGLGQTPAGVPAGNNPSGSPLGPVATNFGNTQNQGIEIGDLNTYLSTAYRAGVDPSRPETVTSLYPLSVNTLNTLVNRSTVGTVNPSRTYTPPTNTLYNFQCSANSQVAGSGQIYSVQPGMIQVQTSRGITDLQLSGCSNLQSTKPNTQLNANTNVYFRGSSKGGNNIELYSMCIA